MQVMMSASCQQGRPADCQPFPLLKCIITACGSQGISSVTELLLIRQLPVQLKILTWQNEEIASDALSIHGYEHYEATDYALAAWYPRQSKALGAPGAPAKAVSPSERSSDFTKWWADGDEPLYYIVSSKVTCRLCQLLLPQAVPHSCLK